MAKCHQCQTTFEAKRITQKYCSPKCRQEAKKTRLRIVRRCKALSKDIELYAEKREWIGALEQPVSEWLMLVLGKAEFCLGTLSYNEIMFDAIDMEGMNQ